MARIVLYLHMHQPYRLRDYRVFQIGMHEPYFDDERNKSVLLKVAEKSYRPMLRLLEHALGQYADFRFSLSVTGTLAEQLERWAPDVLKQLKRLVKTGRVELVGETYYHSLASVFDWAEFASQVSRHEAFFQKAFQTRPRVFRNTELAYHDMLAPRIARHGYTAVLVEGWEEMLGWRSPNYVYEDPSRSVRLLTKNYRLSDDIAFRFSDRQWKEWPLTAEKYLAWLEAVQHEDVISLFMDFETFGEHQWEDTGIFPFMEHLIRMLHEHPGFTFATVSDAAKLQPRDVISYPRWTSWADTERDLSAWLENPMQKAAFESIYALKEKVLATRDERLIETWRRLQTSDHFYYMCTKWFADGDVHAYFNAYDSPYEAYIRYMSVLQDFRLLVEKTLAGRRPRGQLRLKPLRAKRVMQAE